MATVPTKMSSVSLKLSEQSKNLLSENIFTKTQEKINAYNEYTKQVIGEIKETEIYKDTQNIVNQIESGVADTIQTIKESEAYQDTQAAVSETIENTFSIFENVDDTPQIPESQPTPEGNNTPVEESKPETKPEPEPTPAPIVDTTPKSGKEMAVPTGNTSFKSYTNYRKVTDKSTPAYAVVNGLTSPYGKFAGTKYNTQTDPETGVRYVTFEGDSNKYYCAAMGTYYGEVGDTFKVTTDKGNTYHVIMCDAKGADAQGRKDGKSWYHTSGGGNKCVTEFYMDYPAEEMKVYDSKGKYKGTTGTYDSVSQFKGNITSVEKLS